METTIYMYSVTQSVTSYFLKKQLMLFDFPERHHFFIWANSTNCLLALQAVTAVCVCIARKISIDMLIYFLKVIYIKVLKERTKNSKSLIQYIRYIY